MRIAHALVLHFLMAWFAGAVTAQPVKGTAPNTETPPRFMAQSYVSRGIEVAAWSTDSRILFTANGGARELLVWEMEKRRIIDRVRLPSDARSATETLYLHQATLLPDGQSLRLDGEMLDPARPSVRRGRSYLVDVASRRVRLAPPRVFPTMNSVRENVLARAAVFDALQDPALGVEPVPAQTRAEEARVLPPLPRSPDGRLQIERKHSDFELLGRPVPGGGYARSVSTFVDAAMSPDGKRLATLGDKHVSIIVWDDDGRIHELDNSYGKLRWRNANQYLVLPWSAYDDPLNNAPMGVPPDVLLIDAQAGQPASDETKAPVLARYSARCFVTPLPDGNIVGAGLANCRRGVGSDRSLARLKDGLWQELSAFQLPAGAHIRIIAASPRRDHLLVVSRLSNRRLSAAIVDARTGDKTAERILANTDVHTAMFSPDGGKVWLASTSRVDEWPLDLPGGASGSSMMRSYPVGAVAANGLVSDGRQLLVLGPVEDRIARADLESGQVLPALEFDGALAAGFMTDSKVLWSISHTNELRFWNIRTGKELVTFGIDATWTPEGHYDPGAQTVLRGGGAWSFAPEPFTALPSQSFLLELYVPDLASKMLDCIKEDNCAQKLKPIPSLAEKRNFLLPNVEITDVQSAGPGLADVTVKITETIGPNGQNSGAYSAKLLMEGREVAVNPNVSYGDPTESLAEWRAANVIKATRSGSTLTWKQRVQVPTDGTFPYFAAYAFNADRVKSETFKLKNGWKPPPTAKRVARAFVLSIGVDNYSAPRLDLSYAVNDAHVISSTLGAIPGFRMMRTKLITKRPPNGQAVQVSRDDILAALSILAGDASPRHRIQLQKSGHDHSKLAAATADDIVFISFSGHGFADKKGNFSLIPTDVQWPTGGDTVAGSTVSTADLTVVLRAMTARNIAMIIDACYAGAIVGTTDFTPGPVGGHGLGQLAYDKSIWILAATQPDDVAVEVGSLKMGLLTAVLSRGLTATGGPADFDKDNDLTLDNWFDYTADNFAEITEEMRRGGGSTTNSRGVRLVRTSKAPLPKQQKPVLYRMNSYEVLWTGVTLRGVQQR